MGTAYGAKASIDKVPQVFAPASLNSRKGGQLDMKKGGFSQ